MPRQHKLAGRQQNNQTCTRRAQGGQSLVEFALVGIILFALLMGIIDAGRLLFTYSVVSNAAQEGTHYGAIRPRDVTFRVSSHP